MVLPAKLADADGGGRAEVAQLPELSGHVPSFKTGTALAVLESMSFCRNSLVAVLMFTLACGANVNTSRPTIPAAPESFSQSGSSQATPDRYWESFGDATLDRLIDQALSGSPDLGAMWSRLAQSEAGITRASANRSPTLDASLSTSGSLRTDGTSITRSTGTSIGLAASYEVDLWGSLSSTRKISELSALTSAANLRAAAISLTAEVASTWFELVTARQTLRLLDEQRVDATEGMRLIGLRYETGMVPESDDLRQRQTVETLTGSFALAQAQVDVLEHKLAVLIGQPPGFAVPTSEALPTLPGLPSTGVPLDILSRRPEIEASYFAIESADHAVGVAMAAKLPSLRLGANLSSAGSLTDLFTGAVASLVAGLTAPLLNGERLDAEVAISKEVVIEKAHNYRSAVLAALQEVEDALTRESQQMLYIASLDRELALASAVRTTVEAAYTAGTTDQLEVLSSANSVRGLERELLVARRDALSYRISLYRALAGGWEMARPDLKES
tara:strand:- start:40160 stop:41668 length:1509 start_codon:yes stop_codon:yes gene_type:complete